MDAPSSAPLTVINSLDEIPAFASEDEEADYWGSHTFAPHLLAQMRPLTEEEAPRVPRTPHAAAPQED